MPVKVQFWSHWNLGNYVCKHFYVFFCRHVRLAVAGWYPQGKQCCSSFAGPVDCYPPAIIYIRYIVLLLQYICKLNHRIIDDVVLSNFRISVNDVAESLFIFIMCSLQRP